MRRGPVSRNAIALKMSRASTSVIPPLSTVIRGAVSYWTGVGKTHLVMEAVIDYSPLVPIRELPTLKKVIMIYLPEVQFLKDKL